MKTLSQPSIEISSSGERLLEGKLNVQGRTSTRYEGNQAKRYDDDDEDDDEDDDDDEDGEDDDDC